MIILHGENIVQSRERLTQIISDWKTKNATVTRLDAKSLEPAQLAEFLQSQTLFGETQVLIIEELHSLPPSQRKDSLIKLLSQSPKEEIVLWEKRGLTATMLKKFPRAQVTEFKLTNALFKWLDTLNGEKKPAQITSMIQLLDKALMSDGDSLCFLMLVRHVRLLLQMKENAVGGMPPFMIGKLKKQAGTFSTEQLLRLHHKLLELDIAQKTSQSRLGLARELELLLVTM